MALIKWEPRKTQLDPFRSLRQEVDRLFDDFFRGWPQPWSGSLGGWQEGGFAPTVDLQETDDSYVLTAEVPGIQKEELDVNITEDSVTLRGERKSEKQTEETNYYYKESSHGAFQRVVPLPGPVKADQATAKLRDGLLTLTLPKAEPEKERGIKVQVE